MARYLHAQMLVIIAAIFQMSINELLTCFQYYSAANASRNIITDGSTGVLYQSSERIEGKYCQHEHAQCHSRSIEHRLGHDIARRYHISIDRKIVV